MALDPRRQTAWDKLGVPAEAGVALGPLLAFGVGGAADLLVRSDDPDVGDRVVVFARKHRVDLLVVEPDGALLVTEGGFRGIALLPGGALATRLRLEPPAGVLLPPARTAPRPAPDALPLFVEPPRGTPVRAMIADSGWAGVRVRGARLCESDPGWVTREGEATARDFVALRDWLQTRIAQEWGVKLQPATLVVGR